MKTLDTLATFEALLGLSNEGAVVLLGHVKCMENFDRETGSSEDIAFNISA